jgi:hypothetical protein
MPAALVEIVIGVDRLRRWFGSILLTFLAGAEIDPTPFYFLKAGTYSSSAPRFPTSD